MMKGRKGKWPVLDFVDAKLTVPRRDEVSGMCVTVDCLTPEQLGICSGALVSSTHILCCQPRSSTQTLLQALCMQTEQNSVCVCVCLGFVSHLMTRPNRQGDSSSLIGGKCLRSVGSASGGSFLNVLLLFPTDSAWQHGSPGFQELKAEVTEVPAPDASPDATGRTVIPYYKLPSFGTIPIKS